MMIRRIKYSLLFFLFIISIFCIVLLSGAGTHFTAEAAKKESCVTKKCHKGMGKAEVVHGPVATGDCQICHEQSGKHKFLPIKNVGRLCLQCHERVDTGKVLHSPVKLGKCTGCHDPHQSPNQFTLRAAGADLCYQCHKKSIAGGKFLHGPVAVGGCSVCHSPHSSDYPKMLMAEGNDVCFSCHADKLEELEKSKFVHGPVRKACSSCHSSHGSDFQFNLKADSQNLCFSCHKEQKDYISKVTVKHGGLNTEKGCLACHSPHVSDFAAILRAQPYDLCMGCHDREYIKTTGKVAPIKDLLTNSKELHGPIRQKDCSACHNTHGSSNFRMLRAYFPDIFYAGYDPQNYALCFMCHENTIARDPVTSKLTNFRNGDKNLHFVHVNKEKKGRTCRACHDAHATNNPKHIRDTTPFGSWELPVGFTKLDDGGQCLPGCHKLYKYDRKKPAKN